MRVSVIGTGYLGATHATAMAELGHEVVGLDVDPRQVAALQSGTPPFFEPGLEAPLADHVADGSLRFTTDPALAADAEIHFVCVGTPQRCDGGSAELSFVDAAIATLLRRMRPGGVVVGRSTVPVGTAARLADQVAVAGAELVWNPEFLREGFALQDARHPDRLVLGIRRPAGLQAAERLLDAYGPIVRSGTPVLVTDFATAELVKVAANSLLATKVSFINAMAELCDVAGADVRQLAAALGLDRRIGAEFLRAGVGYGGSCLPKDVRALAARAAELGVGEVPDLLHQVDVINCRRRARTVALARDACGGTFRGRRVAVLGLAFKPNSDDIRDSPALAVASAICDAGGNVAAFDPRAMDRAAAAEPRLACCAGIAQACRQADVVLVLTDWPQFAAIAPSCLDAVVRRRVVIDGRSCLDPGVWRAAGWSYRAVGTPDTEPARSDTAERTAELSAVGHEHP